jgi:hypothetical protein
MLVMPVAGLAQMTPAQSFNASGAPVGVEGDPPALSASDNGLYADGTRAINEGRWQDAERIFSQVAAQNSGHADGALYWKAYAQNKLGQAKTALETCAELGRSFPSSSWIHECGALEIEIHAKTGKPVQPSAAADDDLKLLALNLLMKKDEPQALAQLQEILNGDGSEQLKKKAMFILGTHYSDATYAQIVRISYVEGDVRIARGKQNEKENDATWESAVADLPLETGYSLVTGKGRAEIEFEDASTVYLGENSVLTLNDLHTTAGVPYTELALLTGTATLHVHPYVAGELFIFKTPADRFTSKYPFKSDLRVTSYAEATAIASQGEGVIATPGSSSEPLSSNQTVFYRSGHRIDFASVSDSTDYAAWDKWVADRVAQRKAAMVEVMKAAGLATPLPGLADMAGRGKFFECAPYGTCWEPTLPGDRQQPADRLSRSRPSPTESFHQPAHLVQANFVTSPRVIGAQVAPIGIPNPIVLADDEFFFPCLPASLRYRLLRDPVTGKQKVILTGFGTTTVPWAWGVCHAGSWIRHRNHYAWVAGPKRHHVEPVRWVKSGRSVGYVPIHPYDVKGRPPINRTEDVFVVNNKNGLSVGRVKFDSAKPIESLKEPPREFRTAYLRPLAHIEAPSMEAHSLKVSQVHGGGLLVARVTGTPLHFDPKSQNFMTSREVVQGGKTVTVSSPISNREGSLQSHAGSYAGGHGGYVGGGGSSSHASSGGGSSSGGGGGSHGGGGGGTVSAGSTSSASSSSSAASSSSSGGHH